jgi:WD40 repeat protein
VTDTPPIASVAERTRPVIAGAPVVDAHFLGGHAAFVLAEEVVLVAADASERRVATNNGILASAADGKRLALGGDDGRVIAVDADGSLDTIATDPKGRWIDHVALNADAIAWSAGKQAFVRTAKGETRMHEFAWTAGGLAFAPKGLRLAVAHYQGVSLWFPNADAAPERLDWKGSHLGVTFSPNGQFLITAMQEPTLHGWRLADAKDMRMSGYAAKVRSFAWTVGGKWLATSGSDQLILWPFQAKDGPMGKQPRLLAPSKARVGIVASHPKQEIVATGYEDGMVLLVRIDDGAEILAKRPGDAPVTALAWNATGSMLAWGTESGEAGMVDLA